MARHGRGRGGGTRGRRTPLTAAPSHRASRRDAVDVARVLALVIVVLGHLLLAVIDRDGGSVRGANLLALHPGWVWVAALAPMPVFFAAAGWANATTPFAGAVPRVRALVGLGAVVVCAWSAAVLAMVAITGDAGIVGDGARVATQPLWFLAAYVPFVAAARPVAELAARRGAALVGACLTALALGDLARFRFGAADWIGWPGFFLAWGVPWIAGAAWRARSERGGLHERRVGIALAACAAASAGGLVVLAGYEPALIDAVHGARSNTTPPTLYTALAALAQVGMLLAVAGALDRLGRRFRSFWDRAGEVAVGVYVWHLTALVMCAAVIAGGFPVPERLTWLWWTTRPLWWAAVLGVTIAFVASTNRVRAAARRRAHGPTSTVPVATAVPEVSTVRAAAGVVTTAAAAALVGLRGPRTAALALACSVLFVAAWWLLGSSSRARSDT